MMECNKNDNYLFVILEGKGLAILDISNKTNPQILTLPKTITKMGDARSLVYFSDVDGGEYLIITLYYEGLIKVVDVRNPLQANVISMKFIGKQASGIGRFLNRNFVAVQSYQSLTILEIGNISNPVVVSDTDSNTILETYQIAVLNSVLIMPTFEVFQLYSGTIYYYPSLESHTNNLGEKVFYAQFFPINPVSMDISQEKCNLLLVETEDSWPYWMTMDYHTDILTIAPPAMASLSAVRKLSIQFGTQITAAEFASIYPDVSQVISALLFENYIDAYSIPTTLFNPNVPIVLHINTSLTNDDILSYKAYGVPPFLQFSASNLKFYGTPTKIDLGNYSIQVEVSDGYKSIRQNFTFSISNSPPQVIAPDDQSFILGDNFDFSFPSNTFSDKDGDALTYSATIFNSTDGSESQLPDWLSLDTTRLRLYGKPDGTNIQIDKINRRFYQVFTIKVTAMDIADQIGSFLFDLTVSNNFPVLNNILNISSQFNSQYGNYIKIGEKIDFEFFTNTFTDTENSLTYSVSQLPHWLSFSGTVFFGTTSKNDLGDYNITVTASDGLSNVSDSFILSVQNHAPIATTLPDVFLIFGHSLAYILPSPFTDPDNDTLTYTVFDVETGVIPFWMRFDKQTLQFSGSPKMDDIQYNATYKGYFRNYTICVMATDPGDLTDKANFSLVVANQAPYQNPNKTLTYQFQSVSPQVVVTVEKQFDDDTFIDPFNDTITWEARLASEKAPPLLRRRLATDIDPASEDSPLPEWINFDTKTKRFTISPTASYLNYHYVIRVYATNSLLTSSDTFEFTVGLSINYAFTIFLSVIGAIGSALGFLAYRKTFYAVLGKQYYCYSEFEQLQVGEKYEKFIYLLKDDLEMCQLIWKEIKKKHKDLNAIYDASNPQEALIEAINEASEVLISQKKLEPNVSLESFRILEIFQCFLSLDLIRKYPLALKMFSKIKKISSKKHRMWYRNLVTIEPPDLEVEMVKPFPKVQVKAEALQDIFASAQKLTKKKFWKLSDKENALIEEKIIAHVLGIPCPSAKLDSFLEFSRGESILVNWNDIAEIQIVKDKSNSNVIHGSFLDYPQRNNFNSLTTWFTYKIEKDMLVFTGTPSRADIGKLIIRIFNADDMVIREFGVEIGDGNKKKRGFMDKSCALGLFGSPRSSKKTGLMSPNFNGNEEQSLKLTVDNFQKPPGQTIRMETAMNDIDEKVDNDKNQIKI